MGRTWHTLIVRQSLRPGTRPTNSTLRCCARQSTTWIVICLQKPSMSIWALTWMHIMRGGTIGARSSWNACIQYVARRASMRVNFIDKPLVVIWRRIQSRLTPKTMHASRTNNSFERSAAVETKRARRIRARDPHLSLTRRSPTPPRARGRVGGGREPSPAAFQFAAPTPTHPSLLLGGGVVYACIVE